MSILELNAVLYYADYLSLRETSTPVTDNCKYYFIYGIPMNVAMMFDSMPFYDAENKYYAQAFNEYVQIKTKFGEQAVHSFLENICNLQALGVVNANQMLKCIHQYSTKIDRKMAFNTYKRWLKSQHYTHSVTDDDGNFIEEECSRYIAHAERDGSKVYYDEKFGEVRKVLRDTKLHKNSTGSMG